MFTALVICLAVVVLFLLYLQDRVRRRNFPPGPTRFPLLGNMPQLMLADKHILQVLNDHSKIYGPVTSISLGFNSNIVCIHDAKLAREMLNMDETAGRGMHANITAKAWGEIMGLIDPDLGPEWKERKRFFLRSLRDFGFGVKSGETVLEEAGQLSQHILNLTKDGQQDYLVKDDFNVSVVNVIWKMVANKTFALDSQEALDLIELQNEIFSKRLPALARMPFVRRLNLPSLARRKQVWADLRQIFTKSVKEHEDTLDVNDPRDVIDKYLIEMRKGSPGYDRRQLIISIMDLFAAGSETTSTTLRWALLFMVLNPKVQETCHRELDTLEGRPVTLTDMQTLHYCQATILEVLRVGCIAPGTLIHRTTVAIKLGGFDVPRDTLLMVNFLSTHFDPQLWESPLEFRPERFLDSRGSLLKEPDHFFPFSTGKRVCMGEGLARVELFLFFTSLLQKFRFLPSDVNALPNPDSYSLGVTKIPCPFHCKVQARA